MTSKNILLAGAAMAALAGAASTTPSAAAAPLLTPTNVPGLSAVAPAPVALDVVHASDATLAAYAVPPRPNKYRDPKGYAAWTRAMGAYFNRQDGDLRIGHPHVNPNLRLPHGQDGHLAPVNTLTSGNWSGFLAYAGGTGYGSAASFQFVAADLYVPSVASTGFGLGYQASSAWVGIDGQFNGNILQAGAEGDAPGPGQAEVNYLWVEWAPYPQVATPLASRPGDEIYVQVWPTSSTSGYAYISNFRTGKSVQYNLSFPGYPLIAATAEWILEATSENGTITTLPFYGAESFLCASSETFGGTYIYPGTPGINAIDMIQNGTLVSAPYLQTKTSFFTAYQ